MRSTTEWIFPNSAIKPNTHWSLTSILKGFKMSYAKRVAALMATGLTLAQAQAQAAVDAAVSTAIGGAVTDVSATGALILGVVVAIAVIAWIRKVLH